MVKKLLFTTALIVLTSFMQQAQETTPESEFEKAVKLYETKNFDDALSVFNQIVNNPVYKSNRTAATIFKSKILIEKKKYYESEKLLREFLKSSTEDKYRDEARLTLAKNLYEQSFYYPAFKELIILLLETKSEVYKKDAEKYSESIALNHVDPVQIKPIADSSDVMIKPFLLLLTGKAFSIQNRIKEADNIFKQIVRDFPFSRESETARTMLENNGTKKSIKVIIAMLLPLFRIEKSTNSSTTAWEVLEGAMYAIDKFNHGRDNKIGLLVRSISDKGELKDICDDLDKDESVKIILGPIYSNDVKTVLNELRFSDIPVISPTATDDDLVSVSNNFYQANPNFSQRGKVMADYVYSIENKKRLAVINSIEGYAPTIASAFVEEFNKLGGKILLRETYNYSSNTGSTGLSKLIEYKNSLDGVFIPLSDKAEAPYILSQLVQNGIDLPLFGNQDWMQAKGLETSTSLSNKLTITSDYFIDYNDPDYQSFSKEFQNKTGMEVNRNILYGYDAAKFILYVIENTMPVRIKIKKKIESGFNIHGYHNNISFNTGRINRNLNIVKYNNGIFELADRYEIQ